MMGIETTFLKAYLLDRHRTRFLKSYLLRFFVFFPLASLKKISRIMRKTDNNN